MTDNQRRIVQKEPSTTGGALPFNDLMAVDDTDLTDLPPPITAATAEVIKKIEFNLS